MSTGAFAFLLFSDPSHLEPAVEAVRAMDGVLSWHAVEGHYHLAVLAADTHPQLEAQLRALPGLGDLHWCAVKQEVVAPRELAPEGVRAVVHMETDGALLGGMPKDLVEHEALPWEALAITTHGIVGVLRGEMFDSVDRAIDAHLQPLDGVLRLKRDWIIDLTQL